jgi:hypothetical protein
MANLIHCPDCGRMVSTSAAACPQCGCPISEALATPPEPRAAACPGCGKGLREPDAAFCESCGLRLAAGVHSSASGHRSRFSAWAFWVSVVPACFLGIVQAALATAWLVATVDDVARGRARPMPFWQLAMVIDILTLAAVGAGYVWVSSRALAMARRDAILGGSLAAGVAGLFGNLVSTLMMRPTMHEVMSRAGLPESQIATLETAGVFLAPVVGGLIGALLGAAGAAIAIALLRHRRG